MDLNHSKGEEGKKREGEGRKKKGREIEKEERNKEGRDYEFLENKTRYVEKSIIPTSRFVL